MTLRELETARGHLIDRALRHNSEDDWRDLEGVEHEIRELRIRRAQLVLNCQCNPESADYGDAENALRDFDEGLPPHHEDHT